MIIDATVDTVPVNCRPIPLRHLVQPPGFSSCSTYALTIFRRERMKREKFLAHFRISHNSCGEVGKVEVVVVLHGRQAKVGAVVKVDPLGKPLQEGPGRSLTDE